MPQAGCRIKDIYIMGLYKFCCAKLLIAKTRLKRRSKPAPLGTSCCRNAICHRYKALESITSLPGLFHHHFSTGHLRCLMRPVPPKQPCKVLLSLIHSNICCLLSSGSYASQSNSWASQCACHAPLEVSPLLELAQVPSHLSLLRQSFPCTYPW